MIKQTSRLLNTALPSHGTRTHCSTDKQLPYPNGVLRSAPTDASLSRPPIVMAGNMAQTNKGTIGQDILVAFLGTHTTPPLSRFVCCWRIGCSRTEDDASREFTSDKRTDRRPIRGLVIQTKPCVHQPHPRTHLFGGLEVQTFCKQSGRYIPFDQVLSTCKVEGQSSISGWF